MFPLPIFFGDGGFAPRMASTLFNDEEDMSVCGGHCQFDHRPRCQRTCWSAPMQFDRSNQCRRMRPDNAFQQNPELLGLLQPLLASLGHDGQMNPSPQQSPCCGERQSCSDVHQPKQNPECYPDNPLANILGQLFHAQESSSQNENPIFNIIKHVFQMNGQGRQENNVPKMSKWQHQVHCAGFKSDNVYVKMTGEEIIVKAAKEERCRDGSVSMRSMEKRIPIPQNVLAKKITCKMLPNSILKIEGPRVKARVAPKAPRENTQKPQPEGACAGNEESNCGFDMKVLPNGAMVFSSAFPNMNAVFEGLCKQTENIQSAVQQNPTKKSENLDKESKAEVETQVPVQVVNCAPSTMPSTTTETHEGTDRKGNVEQSFPHQPLDVVETKKSEECQSTSADVTSEETCPMTLDIKVGGATTPDNLEQTECTSDYIVEHADSDDDTDNASTGSKDSESSFVLLTDQNAVIDSEEVDTNAIDDAIQEEAQGNTESKEAQNQAKLDQGKTMNETKGAQGPVDIMTFITDAVPNLQKFVVNMNDPSKIPQGNFDPQNIAKMISEAVPAIQNLMVPKVDMAAASSTQSKATDDKGEDKARAEEFNVRLELPVCVPESIRVTVDDEQRLLHITAKKNNAAPGEKSINKSIEVPHLVNVAKVRCQYSDGMLTISAPYKADGKSTRDIPVSV